MADDHLKRLKELEAMAASGRARCHYFSPGDARALRSCVEEIERNRDLIRQLSDRVAICSELLGKKE